MAAIDRYWKNATASGFWDDAGNWFTDAAATTPAGGYPQTGADVNCHYATGETGVIRTNTEITVNLGSGTCDIPNMVLTMHIQGGTFSGAGLTLTGGDILTGNPVFTGDNVTLTGPQDVRSGTFSGAGLTIECVVSGGLFTGAGATIQGAAEVAGGVFSGANLTIDTAVYGGIFCGDELTITLNGGIYFGIFTGTNSNWLNAVGKIASGYWLMPGSSLSINNHIVQAANIANPGFVNELTAYAISSNVLGLGL